MILDRLNSEFIRPVFSLNNFFVPIHLKTPCKEQIHIFSNWLFEIKIS